MAHARRSLPMCTRYFVGACKLSESCFLHTWRYPNPLHLALQVPRRRGLHTGRSLDIIAIMTHDQESSPTSGAKHESAGGSESTPQLERRGSAFLNFFSSFLGSKNPLAKAADPHKHIVWLFDNTAYQPVQEGHGDNPPSSSWQAEVVACVFEKEGRKDAGKWVAAIADHIGLDGEMGSDKEAHERIKRRVQPFLDQVSPAKTLTLESKVNGATPTHSIGPSDRNGIISQRIDLGVSGIRDGTVVFPHIHGFKQSAARAETRFAAPEGWMVISDIDDTIKRTMTMETTGILKTTFAEEPVPIAGMPEFYRHVHDELNPAWFYLSASPYNLYPFLHSFLHEHYVLGTLILRDYSWMDVAGFIRSFTEKTQEYKVDRMEKLHQWFPLRRVLCIGDSTQKDPEAYAEIYKRYPSWIHAIAIRKVTDVSDMEDKNKPERFEDAFKDIPEDIWTVYEDPKELYDFVDGLGMEDQDL